MFVAHVGMGSILQAMKERKQMLLLPRLRSFGEHTTDHQLHTATRFRRTPGMQIVDDVPALHAAMSDLIKRPLTPAQAISDFAGQSLLDGVSRFLQTAVQDTRG